MHAHDRLNSLLNTLEIIDTDEFSALNIIVDFCAFTKLTEMEGYEDGFSVIIDPYPEDDHILDPLLILY
jgi:DNA excision repair protein ERCC-2